MITNYNIIINYLTWYSCNAIHIIIYKTCKAHFELMRQVFEHVCLKFNVRLIEFDGERDHVHLLVLYPPRVSIASLVNSLKGVSSRALRKKFKIFK